MPVDKSATRRRIAVILTVVMLVALVMGPGPGVELVNTPEPLFGIPRIYAWGLLWYVVEAAVVVAAYWLVWPSDDDES